MSQAAGKLDYRTDPRVALVIPVPVWIRVHGPSCRRLDTALKSNTCSWASNTSLVTLTTVVKAWLLLRRGLVAELCPKVHSNDDWQGCKEELRACCEREDCNQQAQLAGGSVLRCRCHLDRLLPCTEISGTFAVTGSESLKRVKVKGVFTMLQRCPEEGADRIVKFRTCYFGRQTSSARDGGRFCSVTCTHAKDEALRPLHGPCSQDSPSGSA